MSLFQALKNDSNYSIHGGADILNSIFLYDLLKYFSMYSLILRIDKATCLSFLFKFILSKRLKTAL